jgi:hypothetical protein
MEVYAVACWYHYYPSSNNVVEVFTDYNEAVNFMENLQKEHQDTNHEYDHYGIFTYEINKGEKE